MICVDGEVGPHVCDNEHAKKGHDEEEKMRCDCESGAYGGCSVGALDLLVQ